MTLNVKEARGVAILDDSTIVGSRVLLPIQR